MNFSRFTLSFYIVKPVALIIAGFDPTAGAGILADRAVFNRFGIFSVCTTAALTAQGKDGVIEISPVPSEHLSKQLQGIESLFTPKVAKIGMLYSPENVEVAAEFLHRRKVTSVLDPMILSKNGTPLVREEAIPLIKERLFPEVSLITPNIPEFKRIVGIIPFSPEWVEKTFEFLKQYKQLSLLLTGGHKKGVPIDLLFHQGKLHTFTGRRITGITPHGTGCIISSAIAANLALNRPLPEAVSVAKRYLEQMLKRVIVRGKIDYLEIE